MSISKNGKTIGLKEINTGGYSHAEKLHEFINEVVEIAQIKLPDLNTTKISSAIKIVEGTARNMGISIID